MTTMPKVKTFLASDAAPSLDVASMPQTGDFNAMVSAVNQNLVHAIDLRSRNRQMHWNAKGSGFYFLHKMFDKFAGELDSIASELGERVMVLGGKAMGTVSEAAKFSKLPPHPASAKCADEHIEGLIAAYETANGHCAAALKLAIRADHHVTATVLTGFARLLEEHRAYLLAHAEPVNLIKPRRMAA